MIVPLQPKSSDQLISEIKAALSVLDEYYLQVEDLLHIEDLDVFLLEVPKHFNMKFYSMLDAKFAELSGGAQYKFTRL